MLETHTSHGHVATGHPWGIYNIMKHPTDKQKLIKIIFLNIKK